jgi:hypothetical protein
MNYILSLPDRILDQLKEAAEWYYRKSGSREIATDWYRGFLAALQGLTENPDSCSLIHENLPGFEDARQLLYGSGKRKTYRAVFQIKGNVVEVLTIRHLSRRDVTPDDFS